MNKIVNIFVFMVLAVIVAPAEAVSHLGQAIKSHVVLVDRSSQGGSLVCNTSSFSNRDFFRVLSNGTVEQVPFVIPKGMHLVVTDVEWSAYGTGVPLVAGRTLRFKIFLGPSTNGAQVYSSGLDLNADNATGRPGKSDQLTAGFVVDPGVAICPYANQETPNFGGVEYIDRLILRGYLTKS